MFVNDAFVDADLNNYQIAARLRSLHRVGQQIQLGIIFLAERLKEGKLTVPQWEEEMRKELKALHVIAAALAKQGIENLTATDYGYIGAKLKEEYRYLRRFRLQIEQGAVNLQSNAFLRRAASYTINSRESFYKVLRANTSRYTQERRILNPKAVHCQTCISEAKLGWQPLGTLRKIGDSECKINCQCRFHFR